jgi:TRAP-type C4-dicarboxylate transport system permease small subunit
MRNVRRGASKWWPFRLNGDRKEMDTSRLEKVRQGIQKVNRFIAGVGACFLLPLMLLTTTDVLARDLFNHPIPGTIELSEYMLAVFVILGIAYTQQVKGYVKVSTFISRLPPSAQLLLEIMTTLLGLSVFSILVWQGLVIGLEEKTVSDMLRVPQYPFRLLVALAACFVCLELLIDFGNVLKKIGSKAS